jgi:hypothetical protein
VDAAGLVGQVELRGHVRHEARAEALGLGAHVRHELRAHDPVDEAGVVLDLGGLLEQAAPQEALDDRAAAGSRARCTALRCSPPGRCPR